MFFIRQKKIFPYKSRPFFRMDWCTGTQKEVPNVVSLGKRMAKNVPLRQAVQILRKIMIVCQCLNSAHTQSNKDPDEQAESTDSMLRNQHARMESLLFWTCAVNQSVRFLT